MLIRWDGESDLARTALLVQSVTRAADRLEQLLLPGEDQPLKQFREQLGRKADRVD